MSDILTWPSLKRVVGRRFRLAGERTIATVVMPAGTGYLLMQEASGVRFKVSLSGLRRNWIEQDEPSNARTEPPDK